MRLKIAVISKQFHCDSVRKHPNNLHSYMPFAASYTVDQRTSQTQQSGKHNAEKFLTGKNNS